MTAPSLTVYQPGIGSVSADGLNTFEQTCNTVSDLRSFVGTEGVQVVTRGTNAVNDGGAGPFYWASTGAYTDNGVSVIVPGGVTQGAWIRLGYFGSSSASAVTTVTTVIGAGQTLTAGAMLGGVLVRTGAGAGFTDTTPTAAQIVAARGGYVGLGVPLLLVQAAGYTQTLQAGAGVSLYGNLSAGAFSTATGTTRTLMLVLQNVTPGSEAVQIVG